MKSVNWNQRILLLHDGPLKKDFKRLYRTKVRREGMWKSADMYYLNSHSYRFLHYAKKKGIPAVCHVHEVPLSFEQESPETLAVFRTYPLSYLAVSRYVKDMLISMGIDHQKIRYCPSGIDTAYWRRHSSGKALRQKLAIPSDAIVVGMSGQVIPLKGVDIWVEMAQILCQLSPEKLWHFVWVGGVSNHEPHYMQEVQKKVQDAGLSHCIHFVGEQDDPRPYYELFDIFTQTSRMESLSLVCLENALMGTPVIAFRDAGGPQEFGDHGFVDLVTKIDPQSMADAVQKIHANPKRQQELKHAAATIIPKVYSINTSVSTMEDEIRRALNAV